MNQQILQKKVEIELPVLASYPDDLFHQGDCILELKKELEILKGRVLQEYYPKETKFGVTLQERWKDVPIVEEEKGCEHIREYIPMNAHGPIEEVKRKSKWCPECREKL